MQSATKPAEGSVEQPSGSVERQSRAGDVTSLRNGAAVHNADQEHGFTPLHWAVQGGRLECLHSLLWQGADAASRTPQGWTPAHLAAIRGQRACLEALIVNRVDLSLPDQKGCTPVHLAAAHGHLDALQIILRAGADLDSVSVRGWSPMHYAAFHGRLGCLQVLAKWGCGLDATDQHGDTPAHLAATEGHALCVKFLVLKGGAGLLQARNNQGETPQDLALRFHKHPVVRCIEDLQQHTGLPREQDALSFPGHAAAFHGDLDSLRKLLECGVININDRDEDGSTFMHKSGGQGHLTCLQWLLEMGGDHTIRNNAGETPRDTAKRFAQLAAVRILGKAGSGEEEEERGMKMRSCSQPNGAQERQGRERAYRRLEELKQQVEIAQSNYTQLGGELPESTDVNAEAQSAIQDLQTELERERERRERLEAQLDEHRAQIRQLTHVLRSVQAGSAD